MEDNLPPMEDNLPPEVPMNLFADINTFQLACDQWPSNENYKMYLNLIKEEFEELQEAVEADDRKEQLDALIDILVVTIGAVIQGGFEGEGAWDEVMRTNFAKIDPDTGKVRKREDGKVLKPEGWQPPNLDPFLEKIIPEEPIVIQNV